MNRQGELYVVGDDGTHRSHRRPFGSVFDWHLRITGEVERPCVLSLSDLWDLPVRSHEVEIDCVSSGRIYRPPKTHPTFTGVDFRHLIEQVGLKTQNGKPVARTVWFRSIAPGACGPVREVHDTALPLEECLSPGHVLLTGCMNGLPLRYKNGGPLRTVAREHYFYKSLKWLGEIELSSQPIDACRGTWERYAGYHNIGSLGGEKFEPFFKLADDNQKPVPVADARATFAELIASGDLSRLVCAKLDQLVPGFTRQSEWSRRLQFVDRAGADTPRFNAAIRGTSFMDVDLSGWNLAHVNFSLSRFIGARFADEAGHNAADLSHCDFEGSVFWNANLTNVTMRDAYLGGTQFYKGNGNTPAMVTGLDVTGAKGLSTETAAWLTKHGAIGARAMDKVVDADDGGFLPFIQVSIFCIPGAKDEVCRILHERGREVGSIGNGDHVTFTSPSSDMGFSSLPGARPRTGEPNRYHGDERIEVRTWVPVEYRGRIPEMLAPVVRKADGTSRFDEPPVIVCSPKPQWLYVPFASP